MRNLGFIARWAEDLCLTDGGYTKVIVTRLSDGQLKRELMGLGMNLSPRNRSLQSTNFVVDVKESESATSFGQPLLTEVAPTRAAELLALWNISPMGRNKLWELKSDRMSCLIDSITLIESCIVPSRQLLPYMLTPLRHAVAKMAHDESNTWIRPKSPSLIGCGSRNLGLGIPWYFYRAGLSAVSWWLTDRSRGKALDRFVEEMLAAKEVPLPLFPPFHFWRMEGDLRANHLLVTRLDVHFSSDLQQKALWVLPDDDKYGLRFERVAAPRQRTRVSSTFVSPDQRARLSTALSNSFEAFQHVSSEIQRAAVPASRLQVHEVIDAVNASSALRQKDYYRALVWLIGVGLWIPSRVMTFEVRNYLQSDGTLKKDFQRFALPYWPELIAAVDAHLEGRSPLGEPSKYRGHRPDANLLQLTSSQDRGLSKREVVGWQRAYKAALIAGLSASELRGDSMLPMRMPPEPPAPPLRKVQSGLLVAQWLFV